MNISCRSQSLEQLCLTYDEERKILAGFFSNLGLGRGGGRSFLVEGEASDNNLEF